MPIALRQSTASQEIPLGYLLDSLDGNSEETALTIANTDIKLWKFGATTIVNKNSGGATHMGNGLYYAVLDATDTDTVGSMVVFCHVSGALAVRVLCQVYEEAVFDALFAASASGYLQPTVAGRTLDVTATGAAGIDWGNVENKASANALTNTEIADVNVVTMRTNALTGAALAADAVTEIQSGLATAANLATVAGYLDTEIAAILADTNELQVDWVNGGRLDLLIDAIKAVTDKLDTALELDGAVYRYTTNSLEQAPAGGGGGVADWNADERTAIRTILGIPASGTTPDVPSAGALKVIDDFLDTEISAIKAKTDNLPTDPADASDITGSFSTVNSTLATIAAYIDTEVAAILATVDTEVAAIKAKTDNLPASPAAVGSAMTLATDAVSAAALSAAAVDEILDEVVEGSVTVRQVLRALLSLAAGKTTRTGNMIEFLDFSGTKMRLRFIVDPNADRTVVVTDLT